MAQQTERSIGEYFNEIENDVIRSKAIKNAIDQGRSLMDMKANSLSSAINKGMNWAATPEGSSYWNIICTKAQKEQI